MIQVTMLAKSNIFAGAHNALRQRPKTRGRIGPVCYVRYSRCYCRFKPKGIIENLGETHAAFLAPAIRLRDYLMPAGQ